MWGLCVRSYRGLDFGLISIVLLVFYPFRRLLNDDEFIDHRRARVRPGAPEYSGSKFVSFPTHSRSIYAHARIASTPDDSLPERYVNHGTLSVIKKVFEHCGARVGKEKRPCAFRARPSSPMTSTSSMTSLAPPWRNPGRRCRPPSPQPRPPPKTRNPVRRAHAAEVGVGVGLLLLAGGPPRRTRRRLRH